MRRSVRIAVSLCGALAWPFGGAGSAGGQTAILERVPTDVTIEIVNGTTGEPARAQRVVLREPGPTPTTVSERDGVDGSVRFADLALYNFVLYTATAWVDGVAYHAEQRGQDFREGKTLVVECYDQTEDLAGLRITGLNVVVRHSPAGFGLEYIAIVANETRPRRTIAAAAVPLRLALAADLARVTVEIGGDRLDPRRAEVRATGDGQRGVAVALTPGSTRIAVRGQLPGARRADLAVAANLDVDAWSLLAWPAELQVRGDGLTLARDAAYPEFSRWQGPRLQAGDTVAVTIEPPVPLADLLPAEAADGSGAPSARTRPRTADPAGRPAFPWRTVVAAVVLLSLYLYWRGRR